MVGVDLGLFAVGQRVELLRLRVAFRCRGIGLTLPVSREGETIFLPEEADVEEEHQRRQEPERLQQEGR